MIVGLNVQSELVKLGGWARLFVFLFYLKE